MFEIFKSRTSGLERDRLRLERELANCDMDLLIQMMDSEEIYSALLEKKARNEISNTDLVSWYAYRQAEDLRSDKEKNELFSLLNEVSLLSRRKHIYFALGHLCKNRKDVELFNLLTSKLNDVDADCKISILIGIRDMDKSSKLMDIEPIKNLLGAKNRILRVNAILSLKGTRGSEVEPLLLELFETTKDSHIKNMICSTLESTGSKKAVPVLERSYKKTRDSGLRDSIDRVLQILNN